MSDTIVPLTTKKDWTSDQEVRWCPGCGDYGILTAVQMLMPELGVKPEQVVFVSGIGCSSRFPYYMNTYGIHSIHGRAPAIATGIAVARPDLDVWVITGDGDALSIGGNHFIHALRRNVNLTILLFNNRIYGLTKGQYSPTSELGKVTKSTPYGSLDPPFNPLAVALGAEATFVARTHDLDRKHMIEVFRAAHDHRGAALVEIFQNCNVFNDAAFEDMTGRERREEMLIPLHDGQPIRFGADGHRGVVMGSDGQLRIVEVADVGEDAILVHDARRDDPSLATALARLSTDDHSPTPIGIFRCGRAAGLRHGHQPAADGRGRAQGPGRAERAAPVQRHLVRRVAPPTGRSCPHWRSPDARSADMNGEEPAGRTDLSVHPAMERRTRPVRSLGVKNVDFGRHEQALVGRALDLRHADRPDEDRGLRLTPLERGQHVAHAVLVAQDVGDARRRRAPGARSRGPARRRTRRPGGAGGWRCRPARRGRRHRARRVTPRAPRWPDRRARCRTTAPARRARSGRRAGRRGGGGWARR